jgi:uncharacterized phage protein (TIGR02220 family)
MGFTKLDEGIVHSSIWSEALATRVLWVTMLAMADSQGFVSSSRSGLLRAANIPQSDFDAAIDILESPDVDSRSPEHDGRRIQKHDGGWVVLNYTRYREFTYSGSKSAIKKRKQRDKRGHKGDMSPKGGDISASASKSASSSVIIEILKYLNDKTGKKFSPKSADTIKHVSARIAEGRTIDDFKHVIDVKVAKWKGKTWTDNRTGELAHGDDYLRPSTLFGAKNFENYVNEAATQAKVKKTLRVLQRDGSYEEVEVET